VALELPHEPDRVLEIRVVAELGCAMDVHELMLV
jgi:hypothetical protein